MTLPSRRGGRAIEGGPSVSVVALASSILPDCILDLKRCGIWFPNMVVIGAQVGRALCNKLFCCLGGIKLHRVSLRAIVPGLHILSLAPARPQPSESGSVCVLCL